MRNALNKASGNRKTELRLLRVRMAARNIDSGSLANHIRRDRHQMTNALCGNTPSWPILSAINRFFSESIFAKPRRVRRAGGKPGRKGGA